MAEAALAFEGITCTFVSRDDRKQRYIAVADTTLTVAPGEFVSVVGPTGCGKSTLLNAARACYMFQGEALLSWRNVLANVMAGLEFAGVPLAEAEVRARDWLRRVGLGGFEIAIRTRCPAACASASC